VKRILTVDVTKAVNLSLLAQEIYHDFSQLQQFSQFPDITPDLLEQASTDTQCAILSDATEASIYIVFRGSEKQMD